MLFTFFYSSMVNVELAEKQEHVIRCIKLGMDVMSSMIIAECTAEEIETLNKDIEFTAKIKFHSKLLEMKLLDNHKMGRVYAASRGNTHGLEWMLERINKDKWGNKTDDGAGPIINNVNVYLPEKDIE